jgi:hypothetical protein
VTTLNFDSTGIASTNLIPGEIHDVDLNLGSAVITEQGLFYAQSLVVRSLPSNTLLHHGVDYIFVGFSLNITSKVNLEVYAGIALINQSLTGQVTLQYQAVGGMEGDSSDLIYQLLQLLKNPPTTLQFEDILYLIKIFLHFQLIVYQYLIVAYLFYYKE